MTSPARRKLKRPELLADEIRRWIVETGACPGERLPNETELRRRFGVGKGAVREALKALEVQGLVALKTGPGGGGALTAPDFERSFQLWLNHFFFQPVEVEQIYALRRLVEPELAAQAAGRLCAADLQALDHSIEACQAPCASADDARRAAAEELAFHDRIAAVVDNPLLSFQCRALNEMLRRFVAIDLDPAELEAMRLANIEAHRRIAAAFARADAAAARSAMDSHIAEVAGYASRLGLAYRRSLVLEADFDVDVRLANQGLA